MGLEAARISSGAIGDLLTGANEDGRVGAVVAGMGAADAGGAVGVAGAALWVGQAAATARRSSLWGTGFAMTRFTCSGISPRALVGSENPVTRMMGWAARILRK